MENIPLARQLIWQLSVILALVVYQNMWPLIFGAIIDLFYQCINDTRSRNHLCEACMFRPAYQSQ